MSGNLATSLARRRGPATRAAAMAAHDRLPQAARVWAAAAVLPWSAASIARLWQRSLRAGGTEATARAALDAAEARRLARERGAVQPPGGSGTVSPSATRFSGGLRSGHRP